MVRCVGRHACRAKALVSLHTRFCNHNQGLHEMNRDA